MSVTAKHIVIFIAALAIPFFSIPAEGMPVRLSKEIFALWAGAAIVLCAVPSWWIRAFIGLCLFHLIVQPAENSFWQMALILSYAGFYVIIREMDERAVRWLLSLVCLAAVAQALLVIAEANGILCERTYSWVHPRGLSGRANDAGAFFVLSLPAFLAVGGRKWMRCAGGSVVLIAIWCTRTTAPMAALSAGVVFFLAFSKAELKIKILSAVLLIAAAAVFFCIADNALYTVREHPAWRAWTIASEASRLKPFGYGLGSFKDLFPHISRADLSKMERLPDGRLIQKEAWQQAINEYVQMRFELGWPFYVIVSGFLATFLMGFLSIPAEGLRLAAATGIVILAVGSAGFFWLHLVDVAFPGVMWIAIWDRRPK